MITPDRLDFWSREISELYDSLEGEIISLIINRLNSGYRDIDDWHAHKLSELRLFNRDVARQLSRVTDVAEDEIERMFIRAADEMVSDIDKAMPYDTLPRPTNLDDVMRGYKNQAWSEVENFVNQTLITSNYGTGTAARAYQDVLNRSSAAFNTGIYTFEQSVERSIGELAQKGIKAGLTDSAGRTLSLESFVRTTLKSTLTNTFNEVRTSRMAEYGVYTVLVTSLPGARDQCTKIQGQVVDLRQMNEIPEGSPYRSIYDPYWEAEYGTAGGHRGANCRHMHIPFIPGVSVNNQPTYDAALNQRVYDARNTQRRIEREIVKYKKNFMVAEHMQSDKADYWSMMVRRRQGAMREHLEANGDYLSRNYKRERVYTPLSTLIKELDAS